MIRKRWVFCMAVLCALLALASCAFAFGGTEVSVLRIGKADAIIISTAEHTILIDAGEEDDAGEILDFFEARRVARLDVMIITHYDKDHVGGAAGVLQGIPVDAVYDADYERDSGHYEDYVKAIAELNLPRHRVDAQQVLTLGKLTLTLIPSPLDTENDNDLSLIVFMSDGVHTWLFAADAEEALLDVLLASGNDWHADVLKMPHHGRMKDNLGAFLDAVMPQVAIITDSDKHPADAETLALLAARGIETYCTKDGDIRVLGGEKGITAIQ